MSLIVHTCSCGHADIWHRASDQTPSGRGSCNYSTTFPCGCETPHLGESEVLHTFDGAGKPTVDLIAPGVRTSALGFPAVVTCGCEYCCALFESMGGAA